MLPDLVEPELLPAARVGCVVFCDEGRVGPDELLDVLAGVPLLTMPVLGVVLLAAEVGRGVRCVTGVPLAGQPSKGAGMMSYWCS